MFLALPASASCNLADMMDHPETEFLVSDLSWWLSLFVLDDSYTCSRFTTRTEQLTKKVQVGKDQEKAQSEKDSHSKKKEVGKNQTNN